MVIFVLGLVVLLGGLTACDAPKVVDSGRDSVAEADADTDSGTDSDTDLDSGLGESPDPHLWDLPMYGSFTIYSEGRWDPDGPTLLFCDAQFHFTGHAYVGECVGCNFEWMLDTVEYSSTGDECTSADYVSFHGALSWDRTIVQSDALRNFSEEAGYAYTYHDAMGFRFGPEHYQLFPSRPYFPKDISLGDGLLSWSRTSSDWDHHAGEDSAYVGMHHYTDHHPWPVSFRRDFELEIHYSVVEAPGD